MTSQWPKQRGRSMTPRERQAARKVEALQKMEDQVAEGTLTIRQMTDEERAQRRAWARGSAEAR